MSFKARLEEAQIPIYLGALLAGVGGGLVAPEAGEALERAIYPVLGTLLYATFLQVPFSGVVAAAGGRFLVAALFLNFAVVPVVVFGLSRFVAGEPAALVGVLLVLLTPCIDYVVVFSGIGGGDARLVLAATPVLMLVQILMLPLYLWLFIGPEVIAVFSAGPFLEAFMLLIALPLGLAVTTQRLSARGAVRRWGRVMAVLPVPLLGLTLFLVAASQVSRLEDSFAGIAGVIPIYVSFLVIMAFVGRATASLFSLGAAEGRALIFTGATRNSLVVLPLALALPEAYALTPAIVVTQTLVELVGMVAYMRVVPKLYSPAG